MKKRSRRSFNSNSLLGVFLAIIPLIGFLIFGLTPLILSMILSFSDPNGYQFDGMTFVGMKNYIYVVTDPNFYKSVFNTFYAMLTIPITLVISVVVANLLTKDNLKGKIFFRTVFFIPYVCSVVAVSFMWKFMLDGEFGIINTLLGYLGINGPDWLGNPSTFMPVMILMGVWSSLGFYIILYSAALTNIDSTVYEAAEIDGANGIVKFFKITLPAISPTTFYLVIIGIIGGLQEFARFQIMAPGGGPDNAGLTIVYYLYNMGFEQIVTMGMGMASAVSWILTIAIMGITWANFKASKAWVH